MQHRLIHYKIERNRPYSKNCIIYHLEFESQNKNGTLGDFIDYLRLLGEFDIELEENAEIEDAVQVSTIHQSKGKEFPIVFIVDVAQGKLPLRYQAKKFYVPNDLAKGLQREDDEKALSITRRT